MSKMTTFISLGVNHFPPQQEQSDGKTSSLMQTGMMGFADVASAYHLCNASVSEDVACVDEAVQHLCCLFDQVTLVGIVL